MIWTIVGWILIAAGVLGLIMKAQARKVPVVGKLAAGSVLMAVLFIIGGAYAVGYNVFDNWNLGSITKDKVSGVDIVDVQVTTGFTGNCTISGDASNAYESDVTCTDANVDTHASSQEVEVGVFTIYRNGGGDPASCPVSVSTPAYKDQVDTTDVTDHWILAKDTQGRFTAYINDDGAATTSSPKQSTYIDFADGSATTTMGLTLDFDEAGHDGLAQYASVPVYVDICGFTYTMEVINTD